MADTNMTSQAEVLKRVYSDYVEKQQNLKRKTLDAFAKSLKKCAPGGEGWFGAINDYGNEAVGAINETESFRSIDSEHYQQYKVQPKIMNAPIQFSGLVAKAAEGNEESFANAVLEGIDAARERLLKDENRQFFGYGKGVLGAPAATTASTVTSFSVASAQYFRANQVIDILTSTGGATLMAGKRIADVDPVNNVLYFATSIGSALATTAVIAKENILTVSAPTDGKEMMGLRGIVDDGTDLTTFENIDATALGNRVWKSRRIDASSANLTSDLLQRLIDGVEIASGEKPDTIIMHQAQRRKYLDIVVPQKRYNDQKLDAGHSELSFNGLSLMLDNDCQTDTVYALAKTKIQKYELAPMEMGTHDGSDVFLRLSRQDVFQAYWRHYCNFGTDNRARHGKIIGLAVPSL